MPASTLAGVIAAVGSLITAIVLAVNAWLSWRRDRRIEQKVDVVHTIVNQQRTDMQRYNRALITALKTHGVPLPIDQSIDPDEEDVDAVRDPKG